MLGIRQFRMKVSGMTCTGCEHHVSDALKSVGAEQVKADFGRGEARFLAQDNFSMEDARSAILKQGYTPKGVTPIESPNEPATPSQDRSVDYDFVVIGSGSAAFAAAIEARLAGARVAMVERGTLGGTCVNIGCVPSKTMLRASDIHHMAQVHPFKGLHTSASTPDLRTVVEQKDQLVASLRQKKYGDLLPEYDIELIAGEARFLDENRVAVGDRVLTAGRYLIATGARPRIPQIPGLSDVPYLTSTSALELKTVPQRLVIIGSGYIAMELGQMFQHWGAQVTMVQRGPVLMPGYDQEVRQVLHDMLASDGIEVMTGVRYERVEREGAGLALHVTIGGLEHIIRGDALLVAAGRDPNTEALNLEAAAVRPGERGEPLVDEKLMTSNPKVYAAGDVTLGPQFVYVAAYEGKIAAQNALKLSDIPQSVDLRVVPAVTFTQPAVASVGITEEEADKQGIAVKTSVLPLDAVTRALANRDTQGVFKLVAQAEGGKILGAQVVSENAGEVIYAATLAVKFGLTIDDLTSTLAPYLTMAEGLKLTALTFDKDVNKLSCCAG